MYSYTVQSNTFTRRSLVIVANVSLANIVQIILINLIKNNRTIYNK